MAALVPEGPGTALPIIIFISAAESFAALTFFPEHLPKSPFVWALIRFFAVNVVLYLVYLIEVWPRLLSPLRHLPRPKVCYKLTQLVRRY